MSGAENPIVVDPAVAAALLWDLPRLNGVGAGATQWTRALRLEFNAVGQLDSSDVLSQSAHLVSAVFRQDHDLCDALVDRLLRDGGVGALMARLIIACFETRPQDHDAILDAIRSLVIRIEDKELQARLLVRLAAFGRRRGKSSRTAEALKAALPLTSAGTRLGVVVRRWALNEGLEVPDFSPSSRTVTPEDPLIDLPWVSDLALDVAARLSAQRLERSLHGIWDSTFHIGRSTLDEGFAAYTQAEWCGATDLVVTLRQLLSSHVLAGGDETAEQRQWALVSWATLPSAKQVIQATRDVAQGLDSTVAAQLLEEVREEGTDDQRAYVYVALGLWDLLDDEQAGHLLTRLVPMLPLPTLPQLNNLVGNLLWRTPRRWTELFLSSETATKHAMLYGLAAGAVEVMPDELRRAVIEFQSSSGQTTPASIAVAFELGSMTDPWLRIGGADAVEVLSWRADALPTTLIEHLIEQTLARVEEELQQLVEGRVAVGRGEGRRLLGELASYIPDRDSRVVDLLLRTCRTAGAPVTWQLGALEGLRNMRRRAKLTEGDLTSVRELEIEAGSAPFGEQTSTTSLRAAQMAVLAPTLTDNEDIAWLAASARGTDKQARLIALVALGETEGTQRPAVEWSLVGGLFDPDDDVVIGAIAAIRRKILEDQSARAVARQQLQALYAGSSTRVRPHVVPAVIERPELNAGDLARSARTDRSWIVRHETKRV